MSTAPLASGAGAESASIRGALETVLARYARARAGEAFGRRHPLWAVLKGLEHAFGASPAVKSRSARLGVKASMGQGNWANVPWIAFLDSRETGSTQQGVYCVFLFRQDMSGVYLTYNQGVTKLTREHGRKKAREMLRSHAQSLRGQAVELAGRGFRLDDGIDLRADAGLGADYEHSTIAYKLYEAGAVPSDDEILRDLEAVLVAYDRYLGGEPVVSAGKPPTLKETGGRTTPQEFDLLAASQSLVHHIAGRGFVFEPWQVAAYVTALRTKPFVILAGVTGTGKSRLPRLVAEATGGEATLMPVRPDWTDSSEVLGYVGLQGQFRPGPLLELARKAASEPDKHFVCIVDEMNLARVEHYFAEVLSSIEDRRLADGGGFESAPLLSLNLSRNDAQWAEQRLPPNISLVGTVNMDESAHGFSRKVLDRAFTLEFSDVDLTPWENGDGPGDALRPWPVSVWYPRAVQLSGLTGLSGEETEIVGKVIGELTAINRCLIHAQLQVGYRTRDEVALFVLNARPLRALFKSRADDKVDPLDLALHMKVLPRIAGGSNAIRHVVLGLLGWAYNGGTIDGDKAETIVADWDKNGRPWALQDAHYPRTAARLCLMWDRLTNEGFTSFWL